MSIYNLLFIKNIFLVNKINKQYIFISIINIPNIARLGSVIFTGVNYIIFPQNQNTNINIDAYNYFNVDISNLETIKTNKNYFSLNIIIQILNNNNIYTKNLLYKLLFK